MEQETIDRPQRNGRPKGMANLSDDVKLGILQQKKLQIYPQQVIAQDFGISRKTVNQMSEDKLSPKAKIKLDSFVDKLASAREKVIQRINEKLDNNDFKDGVYPNLLNAVNSNYRLETNQSTANINIADCAQIAKQAFEIQAKLASADQDQSPLTQAEKIAIYEEICLAQGQQPDVSLLELDSEEAE